jgi:frataxin
MWKLCAFISLSENDFIVASFSGPKRYSIIGGKWVYPQDGVSLHDLLSQELSRALSTDINLHKLQYYTFE